MYKTKKLQKSFWSQSNNYKKLIVLLCLIAATIPIPAADTPIVQTSLDARFSVIIDWDITIYGHTIGLSCSAGFPFELQHHEITSSLGLGLTYYSNYLQLNKCGWETRLSGQIACNHTPLEISLSTNFWNGFLDLQEFGQQTGALSIKLNKLGPNESQSLMLSYENDGTPFHLIKLGDCMDRYRTAGLCLSWNDTATDLALSSKFTCFTGLRDKTRENPNMMKPIIDTYGNRYPYGYVCETGFPYRYSCIEFTIMKESLSCTLFLHHDIFRHLIQDLLAHSLLDPKHQGGFPSLSNTLNFDLGISLHQLISADMKKPETPFSLF